ncbi:MAG: hypothetical protein E7632_10920 [Ruminococcaceae bacterium]|nr:hypothetical protein [Oscillospiraceae bacterium]
MEADRYTLHFQAEKNYGWLASRCGLTACDIVDDGRIALCVGTDEIPAVEGTGEEAYALTVQSDSLALAANSEAGLSQGLRTLVNFFVKYNGEIPCMMIQDEPQIAFRGLHCCIFRPDDGTDKEDTSPEALTKLLEDACLAGYNHVFLEFWGTFPYRKHPYAQWPDSPYTREVVEALIAHIIDDLHMTPLPCQNLTSHAGWSRISSRQHVVLDQRPDLADMWIPGGWCFATENPKTKEYLRDIIDDLCETFRNPPLFHVSSDKCFGFGSTEEDRTKPADALFITHLCNLNTYLQHKGVRMVMWGDMLYSSMDSLYWKPAEGIADVLPKNILINIWTHNDVGSYWADIDYFESRGYETIYSPFLNKAGTDSMVKLCAAKGSLGILQTSWHRPQTALPTILYSAAAQWSGRPVSEKELQ